MRLKFKSTKLHLTLAAVWALLLIPTLIWWKESILWVAGMSLYANFVGHLSSYEAAASAGVDDETHAKLNALADGMADMMDFLMSVLPDSPERDQAVTKLRQDQGELRRVVGLEDD